MEFIDNTGHIFSLKSYNEKPIGYEYNENPYIFWIDSNTSKLSINNYYSRPIYALYLLDRNYDIDKELSNDETSPVQISIDIENSNVYKLISSKLFNEYILSGQYTNLNDYIDLGEVDTESSYLKSSLTNKDLFVIKTNESINNNDKLNPAEFEYLLIPIYPIGCAKEEGIWITNIMIHIYDINTNKHEWCPISIGGEYINEYEELVINERNIGINLPKDILKAVYRESLYNDEFNESLFNEKLKEYLINKTIIRHECGNFNSAIASLKWFEYGDKLTISKLLKTDNDLLNQYLLDYFNIKNDIIDVFKTFVSSALISLKLMINKETEELYPFDINEEKRFFGENKPKMLSLLDYYDKIKIGNHDMPIEDDDEKYWYWKPYFDFSFLELGIKLAVLKKYYKQYFLPLHLYIHNASLGYKVYANDIKLTTTSGVSMSEPIISLNAKDREVEFKDIKDYYFSKQIHYIDHNFNEFHIGSNIEEDGREWYEIDDTCVSIPIKFINNENNDGYFNCVLLLLNDNISNKPLLETHFSFYQYDDFKYENLIIYPKKVNLKRADNYWWIGPNDNPINTHVKLTDEDKVFSPCLLKRWWIDNFNTNIDARENSPYIKKLWFINDTLIYDYIDNDDNKPYLIDYGKDEYSETWFIYVNDYDNNLKPINTHKFVTKEDLETYKKLGKKSLYVKEQWYANNTYICDVTDKNKDSIPYIKEQWYVNETYICDKFEDYEPYVKYNIDALSIETNYLQYWVNDDFLLKILVNNKWYEYRFNLKIHNPTIDFGTLRYRYYLNEHNYLLNRITKKESNVHSFIFTDEIDKIRDEYNANFINLNDTKTLDENSYNLYLASLNNYFYDVFNLDGGRSFVKTVDLDNIDNLWQYFESNYNVLSPFSQLNRIDDVNKAISFNSYMHNTELINVNNIDFDIDFYKILKYHLDHNLMYIDGTLLNRDFYQYILYHYEGRNVEVLIHKDMIGTPVEIPYQYFNKDKIIVCAWKDNLYILEECGEHNNSYYINTLYNINNIFVSEGDNEDSYPLLLDSLSLKYDRKEKAYYSYIIDVITGEEKILDVYPIYDKLYSNLDYVYDKYKSQVNLPNLDKYKNSIHLFDIYKQETLNTNILIFHNDIDVYINGLRFIHNKYSYKEDEIYDSLKIFISGNPHEESINTKYLDVYGLHLIEPYIENGRIINVPEEIRAHNHEYALYVKRDYRRYYEPNNEEEYISKIYELENIFEYDTREFSYYIENNPDTMYTFIGNMFFKTLDDYYNDKPYDSYLTDEYKDIKIFREEKTYYFYDLNVRDLDDLSKYYKNKILYKIYFYNADNNQINVSLTDISNISYDHIKLELYYIKRHIVRNRLYLLLDFINEYLEKGFSFEFLDNNVLRMYKDDFSVNIQLIQLSKKYIYTDNIGGHLLSNQNPAYYWFNVDDNSIVTLPSYLNELERFTYNSEEESLSNIISQLDSYKEKYEFNKLHSSVEYIDDTEEARYRYINYLSKDFTGKKGKFKLNLESNFITEFTVRVMLEIYDKNNNKIIKTNLDDEFELSGDEQSVILYIQLDDMSLDNHIDNWIIARLYEIQTVDKKLEYIPEETGDDVVVTKFLNKEYLYGNNKGEFIYNLYDDFFELNFNIYDSYIKDGIGYCELMNSVYEARSDIKLNMYLDYDFYLMHDDQYWYGLYISKQTCNCVRKLNDLIVPEENKIMHLIGKHKDIEDKFTNYVLKYNSSSKEYLINRLEFLSSYGLNQFKDDDIIACYVHNNNRLPINPYISSKWLIKPMSLGMTEDSSFDSNAEMTILSMPKNDNKYQKGYYKATIKYSLDRDIQHQFKDSVTFRVS